MPVRQREEVQAMLCGVNSLSEKSGFVDDTPIACSRREFPATL